MDNFALSKHLKAEVQTAGGMPCKASASKYCNNSCACAGTKEKAKDLDCEAALLLSTAGRTGCCKQ